PFCSLRPHPASLPSLTLNESALLQVFITSAHDVSGDAQRIRQGPFAGQHPPNGQLTDVDEIAKLIGSLPGHRVDTLPIDLYLNLHSTVLQLFEWGVF